MSYKNLEVWKISDELVKLIHKMTMEDLPAFEKYEVASQIRRSVKSIQSNIVEGYGRRVSQKQFLQFLVIAQGSLDETRNHLETLWGTKSLNDEVKFNSILDKINLLGRKLYHLMKTIRSNINT